jgi:transcriptional regulator with XRE-family HTH domain
VEASNMAPSPGGASEYDTPQARGGPTALRIILGGQLRRLREASGVTREAAAGVIRGSASKISRLELGRVGSKKRDVADLLSLYGVTDERRRESLLALADEANTPGWWQRYGELLPEWFEVYIGLEEAASRIRTYEVQFVPGLMQTRSYARAVVRLGHPNASEEELEQRVELRMKRRRLLTVDNPLTVWAVVDESALRRPIGGLEVMRAQLRHLLELTELPNVTLQMMPFHRGGHAAAGGPFSILRFAEPELADVVYLEQLTSALYLDKRRDVDGYSLVMDRLCVEATPSDGTVKAMATMLRELERA